MKNHLFMVLAALFLASAKSWALSGLEVMQKVEQANRGTIGSSSAMTMILIDAQGNRVERGLRAKTLEDAQNGDKSILEFLSPLDVKGSKLLTWSPPKSENQQWLYMPQFKRVKKINSRNQSGSFMGSEFSFEDLAGQDIDAYEYTLLEENEETWKVQSVPKGVSGYTKLISLISKKILAPVQVEYFDRKGELLKISKLSEHKKYSVNGKDFHLPSQARMDNVQTKRSSLLLWSDQQLGIKLPERDFNANRLKE